MEPLHCIIVDDEEGAHLVLKHYLKGMNSISLKESFYNAIEAMNYIYQNKVDLLFLDINMPGISGMEMLSTMSNPPLVVLTTAYKEYALESYKYQVVDYLVKPFEYQRFISAIDKVFMRFKPSVHPKETGQPSINPDFLMVKVNGDLVKIQLHNILYIQSFGNYIKIYTDSATYLSSMTTSEIEHKLDKTRFKRIHKSYIVALNKIERIARRQVYLENAVILPIGVTFQRELVEHFNRGLNNE